MDKKWVIGKVVLLLGNWCGGSKQVFEVCYILVGEVVAENEESIVSNVIGTLLMCD